MATIALYNRPEMLRSGDRTLQPAQFRLADSGMAEALGGIAQMTSKLAVSLNEKSKAATSANSLIELESDIAADELQRTKWFQMNQSDNQIEKDGINTWEQKATTDVDALMAKWDSRSAGLDQETQIRIKQRLNNYKSNSVAGAWGSSLKQKGQNFGANFNAMLDLVSQNGDSRAAEQVLAVAGKGGLFSKEQTQAYSTKLQLAKDNFVLTQANTQIQNLLDSAKVNPANFNTAKAVVKNLRDQGKIQHITYQSMIDDIDLKARYNFNLQQAKNDIQKDPTQVLNDIKDTTMAKPVVSPTGFSGEISGPATVWGMNLDGTPDPQDKGETAWGKVRTDNKTTRGVSLPFATLEKMFGPDYHNYIEKNWPVNIEVTNPNTGVTVVAPIIDKGPAAETGNAIDLTFAVATELGSKGKDVMTFKLAGGEPGKGKYQWASSQDLEELQIQAGKQVTAEATDAFATIKQNIDLNKIVATETLKTQFPGSITIDEALKNTYYKALNYANDPHIQVMRDTLYAYADKAKNEQTKDDPVVYDKTISKIDEYDATKDPYGSQAASLEAFINAKFNQEHQSQLKDRLNSHRTNTLTYKANKVAAPAISLLNKSAYDDQLLGQFREMQMVEIIDKDRKVHPNDILANTLLMLPKRDASGAIVNDANGEPMMERREPVQADVDAGLKTGTKRWVIPRSATSVSYLQYKGPDQAPELVTVKKDKLSDAQIVYKENSEQKTIVTDRVKNIRETIEEDIKTGRITDSEQAINKVKAMIEQSVNIKMPGASTPNGTPALPPSSKEEAVNRARELRKKYEQ